MPRRMMRNIVHAAPPMAITGQSFANTTCSSMVLRNSE
jgi:hypothetical protein